MKRKLKFIKLKIDAIFCILTSDQYILATYRNKGKKATMISACTHSFADFVENDINNKKWEGIWG